jgi:hypothetical protein
MSQRKIHFRPVFDITLHMCIDPESEWSEIRLSWLWFRFSIKVRSTDSVIDPPVGTNCRCTIITDNQEEGR